MEVVNLLRGIFKTLKRLFGRHEKSRSKEIIEQIFKEFKKELSYEESERERYISSLSNKIRRGGSIGGIQALTSGAAMGFLLLHSKASPTEKPERGLSMNQK